MKGLNKLGGDLADRLELPREALLNAAMLTVTDGRRALVENHRGILEYSGERVIISTGRGKLCLMGSGLRLAAMSGSQLLVVGKVQSAEWE